MDKEHFFQFLIMNGLKIAMSLMNMLF